MKCNKCGAEIVDGGKFCPNCGKNRDFFFYFNRVIIGIVLFLILGVIIVFSFIDRIDKENDSNSTISNQDIEKNIEFIVSDTLEINQIGFYKNSNVLEERYNKNGDLIYCKYKMNNEISEYNYEYKYDNTGRVTNIDLNSKESTLDIEYNGDKISKVITNYEVGKMEYYISYSNDETVIKSFFSTNGNVTRQSTENEYAGAYIIINKELNGKNYSVMKHLDENNVVQEQIVYEINQNNNIYSLLSYFPAICYIDEINTYKYSNVIIDNIGMGGFDLFTFNKEKYLYMYRRLNTGTEDVTTSIYDNQGRILSSINKQGDDITKKYHKYEVIDDKTFWKYNLYDLGKYYQAYDVTSRYLISIDKCYLDDNNKLFKYETGSEKYISQEEFIKLEEEYEKYIYENKEDMSDVINTLNEDINSKDVNTLIGSKVKELTYEEKKVKAKEALDLLYIDVSGGESDISETFTSPIGCNISACYTTIDENNINYKLEKLVITNQQTNENLEITDQYPNSDSYAFQNINLVEGTNTIIFTFYDNYGNTRQETKIINKLNW